MNKIISKEQFSEKVFRFEVEAPLIARSRRAGHFVIVRVGETGERIPLTIAEADKQRGTITLVVQNVGLSSQKLCALEAGDYITDGVGPLGRATHIDNFGTVVCAGGGVGVAPLLYFGKVLKDNGMTPVFLLGARSAKDLLLLDEYRKYGEVCITTEDGSEGEKGFVTNHSVLQRVRFDQISTCGPKPMMVAVAKYAHSEGICCEASLENKMACGVGACLCCVEGTKSGNLCVCKDGPVFNVNDLSWQI